MHGYFEVDLDILWDVAVVDVPRLADQVRMIKSELADEPESGRPFFDEPVLDRAR
ncbi:MAG: hypothetical protein J2P27_00040 [Actinobacteria bacterium]|nr:hypothetical protein [Actinomycetota bacterium]